MGLGAWTRLVDAGLGCPDWPGCYGFAIWPMSETEISLANELYPERKFEIEKAVPEVVHRYFAGSLVFDYWTFLYAVFSNQKLFHCQNNLNHDRRLFCFNRCLVISQ